MLDHIMAPINTRSTQDEIEGLLVDHGFQFERLKRGCDFDQVEYIYQKNLQGLTKDLVWKHGVGENRYLLKKL
ncbi:hypothetical protein [Polynucleobacter sp. Adler-ghost]|uniref:hypothetical protein n=1 Tax=Polynucleobacter sp. Adler-ghost TaxID=2770234 RepID=UPI001BFCE79B|nr:hypothetical protein [Polynucleobacter sp. Adler-ghost]QWE31038.1 hypothetical protein ICV89_01580 [Polynucleobacter sp. Adler-ghost]